MATYDIHRVPWWPIYFSPNRLYTENATPRPRATSMGTTSARDPMYAVVSDYRRVYRIPNYRSAP